jgi:hypothetical protein
MIVAIILDDRNIKQQHRFRFDYELEYFLRQHPNYELISMEEIDDED